MFSTAIAVIVIMVLPCKGGSSSSPFKPGEEGKTLSIDSDHLIFTVNKNELAMRINRFELAYINAQLKDPAAFVSRQSIKASKVNAQEVLNVMKQRRKELTQHLLKYAKQKASGQKEKGNYPPALARPPLGNTPIGIMASDSIEDAIRELTWFTKDSMKPSIQCETRQGRIEVPGHFARGEMEDRCVSPWYCDGGVNYSLDDGLLPFYGEVHTDQDEMIYDEMIYYVFYGQLGFKFPAPLCDSELSWQFQLAAGAGLFSDAGNSWVYLDCNIFEMEDAYGDLPNDVPTILAGSVLEINDNIAWKGNTPQTFDGRMNVKAGKESALFIGLFVMIAANSGETMTSGHFQVYNMGGNFSPGVRYRLDPKEPPM